LAGERKIIKAEPAKNVKATRRIIIDASVEAVLVIRTRAGTDEVVQKTGPVWLGKSRENRLCLWRDHAIGNEISSERRAPGTVQRRTAAGIKHLPAALNRGIAKVFAQIAEAGWLRAGR